MPLQSNNRQIISPKIPLSLSCFGHLLMDMGSALKYVLYTQRDSLGEANFSLVVAAN